MADAAITGQRGTTIGYLLTVTLDGAAFDVTLPDTVVTFTAKRKRSDLTPLFAMSYRAVPGISDPGMKLRQGETSIIEVSIPPATTADFTGTEFLVFDAILTEPDGRETAIAKGSLTVRAGVGS